MIHSLNINGEIFEFADGGEWPIEWNPVTESDEIIREALRVDVRACEEPDAEILQELINRNLQSMYEKGTLCRQYRCTMKGLSGPEDFEVIFRDPFGNIVHNLV